MKVITTETTVLKPINLPFDLLIVWNRKRGEKEYWFTPTGKAKIGLSGLSLIRIGNINDDDDKKIIRLMKKYKCDILTDGRSFYTRAMRGLAEITNGYSIVRSLLDEWNVRHEAELWEEKKEYVQELDDFEVINDE
jgi:hypothetical protein